MWHSRDHAPQARPMRATLSRSRSSPNPPTGPTWNHGLLKSPPIRLRRCRQHSPSSASSRHSSGTTNRRANPQGRTTTSGWHPPKHHRRLAAIVGQPLRNFANAETAVPRPWSPQTSTNVEEVNAVVGAHCRSGQGAGPAFPASGERPAPAGDATKPPRRPPGVIRNPST